MENLMVFEGNDVNVIEINGEPMFEIYSTGSALGYSRWTTSKGKQYFKIEKTRVNKVLKNAEISTVEYYEQTFINITGLKKMVSMCHSKNKIRFIDWLKENNFVQYDEVFASTTSEEIFMNNLEKIFSYMNLSIERQKIDNNYRLDGYISEIDVVIEYDENGHAHYNSEKEYEREMYIKNKYSHIVRVNDFSDVLDNVGIVVNKIFEIKLSNKNQTN